jgi:hypothetical protein
VLNIEKKGGFVRAGSISTASILPNTVVLAARDVGSRFGALRFGALRLRVLQSSIARVGIEWIVDSICKGNVYKLNPEIILLLTNRCNPYKNRDSIFIAYVPKMERKWSAYNNIGNRDSIALLNRPLAYYEKNGASIFTIITGMSNKWNYRWCSVTNKKWSVHFQNYMGNGASIAYRTGPKMIHVWLC